MRYTKLASFLLLLTVVLFNLLVQYGCANIVPPGGGPRDSLPPKLVNAVPADSALKVTNGKIILYFNEFVEVKNASEKILVSPYPSKQPEVEHRLRTVTVKLKDSLLPNTTYVVDYKTGDVEKARDKMKGPAEKDPNGGDYWRQAVFYKILVDNYELKDWKVVSTEFDFVEPDKKKKYRKEKIVITPDDIAIVTRQIETVWQKIQDRDFYTGCGKEDCHWCNFVKTNQLAVALHQLEEEPED